MNITVIGAGYVGLVTAACFASLGNKVVCLELDEAKLKILKMGQVPIYEPGLVDIVTKAVADGNLLFTSDVEGSVAHGLVQFVAVGTPPNEDGSADLTHVLAAVSNINKYRVGLKVVVHKSTVPVGTGDKAAAILGDSEYPYAVVSNPEFLKEGAAVKDFLHPSRVVLGADSTPQGVYALSVVRHLYEPIASGSKIVTMSIRSAELTKYAANAMLATRIAFMNEVADLAAATGADIEDIRKGIGSDPRIGPDFLRAGIGYGGSCFPKDVQALIKTGYDYKADQNILAAVEASNDNRRYVLTKMLRTDLGCSLDGVEVAVWGLAFKPGTDDMRMAPSETIVRVLLKCGARVRVYDPVAINAAKAVFYGGVFGSNLVYAASAVDAIEGAHALLILTEWDEFKAFDLFKIAEHMVTPNVYDGRNIYNPKDACFAGLTYRSIGRS